VICAKSLAGLNNHKGLEKLLQNSPKAHVDIPTQSGSKREQNEFPTSHSAKFKRNNTNLLGDHNSLNNPDRAYDAQQ
jgi:hypothetical protein